MKMQCFIYFFMIFVSSLATDVSVYDPYDYFYRRYDAKPVIESAIPWKFRFTSNDRMYMTIFYLNKPPSVTTVSLIKSDLEIDVRWTKYGEKLTVLVHKLGGSEAIIDVDLYTLNGLCRSIRVAEGRVVPTVRPKETEKEYKYTGICFKDIARPCILLIDLKDVICEDSSIVTQKSENLTTTTPLPDLENNNTTFLSNFSSLPHENVKTSTNSSANNTESNNQQPSPPNLLVYVISSVIVMCIIIMVIYMSVKKYCFRNSQPVETMELDTYATPNEVVYADLSLMHGDSQPQRCDEESSYAEIIGVLHPH